METKIKKAVKPNMIIDIKLNKFKEKDFFPEKTDQFNEMVNRIGEDKFAKLTGSKKRN